MRVPQISNATLQKNGFNRVRKKVVVETFTCTKCRENKTAAKMWVRNQPPENLLVCRSCARTIVWKEQRDAKTPKS